MDIDVISALSSAVTYIWMLLLEHVHQSLQVVVLVRHYDLIYVVQQDVAGPVHGSVHALVERGQLAEVVHVPSVLGEQPATRRIQVLVDGPRNYLHEALLTVALQQAVQVWATAGFIDNHPVHTKQSGAK